MQIIKIILKRKLILENLNMKNWLIDESGKQAEINKESI